MKKGSITNCIACNNEFARRSIGQEFCSQKCQRSVHKNTLMNNTKDDNSFIVKSSDGRLSLIELNGK